MRRSILSLLPLSFKYAPGQDRDDHGRFAGGGGGSSADGAPGGRDYLRAGLHIALASALLAGSSNATKIIAGLVVAAGGISHLQAYIPIIYLQPHTLNVVIRRQAVTKPAGAPGRELIVL